MTIKNYQKNLDKDITNFITELQQKFPNVVITSGFRENAVTKFGKKSRHSTGEAVDIRINPEISNWLYNTKEGITTLNKYGLGMLDESKKENQKFGNAIHAGKDYALVERARNRYKELFGYDYGQEPVQKQEEIIYELPSKSTTVVNNLPKTEENINFAEQINKLEQDNLKKQAELEKVNEQVNNSFQYKQPIQEEQVVYEEQTPNVNYEDIFNQVSQFVDTPIAQQGSIIDDNMGQWKYPGEITRISSPNITMKDVPYQVLGVANTGEVKLMLPNQEYYFNNASTVTEYPLISESKKKYLKKLKNG